LPDQPTRTKLRAALTASVAMTLTVIAPVIAPASNAHASAGQRSSPPAGQPGGAPVGPALISPLGHFGLCWQAEGNGSMVTLESCNAAIQGQLWTFTGDGVVMNGNGYCVQNGGTATPGQADTSMFLSFSGQCAGARSQSWTFSGVTNVIRNPAAGVCAFPQGGADVPGAAIVGRPCGRAGHGDRWSFGLSRLTLSAGRGGAGGHGHQGTAAGPGAEGAGAAAATGGPAAAGAGRAFTAEVTVANAAGAMTAYGAVVSLRPPKGLTVTRLAGSGALSDWTCTVRKPQCRGSLAGGLSGVLTVSGAVTAAVSGRFPAQAITVHALVTGTNEPRRGVRPAHIPVHVFAVVAAGSLAGRSLPGGGAHGPLPGGAARLVMIIAGCLVVVGIVLAVFTRRRPRRAAASAGPAPEYPAPQATQNFAGPATPGPATPGPAGPAAQESAGPPAQRT
jgi:Ricin-type beta-trefoil lectin domain